MMWVQQDWIKSTMWWSDHTPFIAIFSLSYLKSCEKLYQSLPKERKLNIYEASPHYMIKGLDFFKYNDDACVYSLTLSEVKNEWGRVSSYVHASFGFSDLVHQIFHISW